MPNARELRDELYQLTEESDQMINRAYLVRDAILPKKKSNGTPP